MRLTHKSDICVTVVALVVPTFWDNFTKTWQKLPDVLLPLSHTPLHTENGLFNIMHTIYLRRYKVEIQLMNIFMQLSLNA